VRAPHLDIPYPHSVHGDNFGVTAARNSKLKGFY